MGEKWRSDVRGEKGKIGRDVYLHQVMGKEKKEK
jgi:hypothetical protein